MFAEVIINTRVRSIDRPFTYRIPEDLSDRIRVGSVVTVPFGAGNAEKEAFVTGIQETTDLPPEKTKEILGIPQKRLSIDEELLELAVFMRHRYGGTLSQAFSTVQVARTEVSARKKRFFVNRLSKEELDKELTLARQKKYGARIRLLEAFQDKDVLPSEVVTDRLKITDSTLKPLLEKGFLTLREEDPSMYDRMKLQDRIGAPCLNEAQKTAVEGILKDGRTAQLLFGVTGSGKTEVYLSLIEKVLSQGKEVIVLIPEISLTYQTVMRFYGRFGELVSLVHSRLSKGEKAERFEKARTGEIKVMIGPRSALFTPFWHLGLIIIDEFHEPSYLSDQSPKYNTVEVAIWRAKASNCKVVLGSATPLVESYSRALKGEYGLHELPYRAVKGSSLPLVEVVDLREELAAGNRSVFSRRLQDLIREKLEKKEQIMLFLNRRGYSGAVSCRHCGEAIRCPHCSVALNYHKAGRFGQAGTLKCHLCGFERPMVEACPSCHSKLIGTFGIGTEKVEQLVQETFPGVRTLRMDADTTSGKNGHQEILEKFSAGEADVLIGTQMIVKGHDFPNVTLVGILAADLSLNVPDYRSAERTFQLLTQAEGRAGRGEKQGICVVQTYMPEHYAVHTAASQDYRSFFEAEIRFRKAMHYPPEGYFMTLRFTGPEEKVLKKAVDQITEDIKESFSGQALFLGPAEESAFKVKDQFRYSFSVKTRTSGILLKIKTAAEKAVEALAGQKIYLTRET